MNGTFFGAESAVYALFGVDDGDVALHGDCALGAGFYAHLTSDAATGADFADELARHGIAAGNMNHFLFGYHGDDATGTGFSAGATADAFIPVDFGDAVNHVDGIEFAGLNACAESEAAVSAGRRPFAGNNRGGLAVGNSQVNTVFFSVVIGSATTDEGNLRFTFICGEAHYFSDTVGDRGASDDAFIDGTFSFDAGFCIVVASGVTTAAAVSAGQCLSDFSLTGIDFDGKTF